MLIGRDTELRSIGEVIASARRGGAHLVHLEGEAGVGKSSLLAALTDAAQSAGDTVLRAVCDELGVSAPFSPIIEAARYANLPVQARIDRRLTQLGERRSPSAVIETLPELRAALIEELVDLVEEQCLRGPTVLSLDDGQWADGASVAVVVALLRHAADLPLAILVATRPQARRTELHPLLDRPDRLVAPDRFLSVNLSPLHDADVVALVGQLAGDPPGPTLTRLLSRCAGNALLVTELVTSLRDAGLLVRHDGVVDATGDHLPTTLTETVRSRMARLEGENRAVATIATVIGSRFTIAEMAAITGRSALDLLPSIEDLIQARLLVDDGTSLSFRHDLVREAIAEALPASLRTELHRAVATGLRATGAPTARVAEHLALAAAPGDTAAIDLLEQAAAEVSKTDPAGAIRLLRRGLDLTPPTDLRQDALNAQLVDALAWSGQQAEAERTATELLLRPLSPEVEERVQSALGRSLLLLGRPTEAITHEERVIELHRLLGRSTAWAHAECAACRLFGLDLDGALADARTAEDEAQRDGDTNAQILALSVQCFCRNMLGESPEAVELGDRAVALADASPGAEGHRFHPNLFRGIALQTSGRTDAARAAFRRGTSLGEALGAGWALPIYQFLSGLTHFDDGAWDDLLAEVAAGVSYSDERSSTIGQLWAHAVTGLVHSARGQRELAEDALAKGDSLLAAGGLQYGADWHMLARATYLDAFGDRRGALDLLTMAWEAAAGLRAVASLQLFGIELVRLAKGIDDELAARVTTELEQIAERSDRDRLARARSRWARGLVDGSLDDLERAAELLGQLDHPVELAHCRIDMATIISASGDTARAAHLLEQSAAYFESLGATVALGRCRALLDSSRPQRPARRSSSSKPVEGWEALTRTETEIAEEVCAGRSNGEVAVRLGISRRTVEAHLRSIYTKLNVSTRLALAISHQQRLS